MSRWMDEFLDPLRQQGDPTADSVIAALAAEGQIDAVNGLMRTLGGNDRVQSPVRSNLVANAGVHQAGTLMTFSWIVLDGMRKLGFAFSAAEAEGSLHLWNSIGSVMGIREDLLPVSVDDAGELVAKIQHRNYGRCDDGVMLTRALIEMLKHFAPGHVFDSVPQGLIRYLLGDANADRLAGCGKCEV